MQDRDFETYSERFVERVKQLSDRVGYFERFFELCAQKPTYRDAWEAVEAERESVGLPERYSSYESFRVQKAYHINRLIRISSMPEVEYMNAS